MMVTACVLMVLRGGSERGWTNGSIPFLERMSARAPRARTNPRVIPDHEPMTIDSHDVSLLAYRTF